MRSTDMGLKLILIWAALAPFIHVWYFLSARITPWWSDPGEWLKYANGVEAWFAERLGSRSPDYEAMSYTMWDQGVFQYPPLPFLILIQLKYLFGPLQALKIMGSVLFALQPIPIYFLAKKITGSRLGGLIAAYATSFMPINIEMLGWGGYPNLLGLLLLPTNIFFAVSVMSDPKLRNMCLMVLTSVLMPFLHHLTLGIFLGILLFWMLLLAVMRKTDKIKYLMYNFIAGLVALAFYRMVLAYPSQFVWFNEAAYYSLRVNFFEAAMWALKTPAIMIAVSMIAAYIILRKDEVLQKEHQALLLAWFLFPILATQSYLLGIAIDFNRVFFFIFQPAPIVIASPFSLIKNMGRLEGNIFSNPLRLRPSKKLISIILITSISAITTISIFSMGMSVVANVAGWYSSQDIYGDYEKVSALEWIKRETPLDSVFVADEYMGRWIEGYASRRTYLYMEPRFLFIKGQLERYYIASSVLLADKEIRNCYLRVLDQAPYNMSYTPIICFWNRGEYKETLYIDEKIMVRGLENLTLSDLRIISRACTETSSIETYYINKDVFRQNETLLMKKVISVSGYKVDVIYESVIKNVTVYVNISLKRSVNLVEVYDRRAVIHTDLGKVLIDTSAEKIKSEGRKIRFYSEGSNLTIQVFMENPVRNELDQTLVFESSKIVRENSISYIVVPRISPKGLETLPEYQHLLGKFKVAYVNDRVIILEADKIAD